MCLVEILGQGLAASRKNYRKQMVDFIVVVAVSLSVMILFTGRPCCRRSLVGVKGQMSTVEGGHPLGRGRGWGGAMVAARKD